MCIFWDFDGWVIVLLYGFVDVRDYYWCVFSCYYLLDICMLSLIIYFSDDFFVFVCSLFDCSELVFCIELELYVCGGYVGFVDGFLCQFIYYLE